MIINVTHQHIEAGAADCYECPVALAVQQHIDNRAHDSLKVAVRPAGTYCIQNPQFIIYIGGTPYVCDAYISEWIDEFDHGETVPAIAIYLDHVTRTAKEV